MPFPFPLRLSATGLVGLAALTTTHWMRDHLADPAPALAFALGVMPNVAAALAMPLILASFTPQTSQVPVTASSHRAFILILAFTTIGLLAWEVVQTRSDQFVFDPYDLLATLVGAALAGLAYRSHARRVVVP